MCSTNSSRYKGPTQNWKAMHRPRKIHRRGWDTAFGQALCDIPYFPPRWQTTTLQGSLLSRCIDFFLLLTSVAHFSSRPWRVEMCWGGSWSAPISEHRGGKLGRSLVFRLEGLMPHLLFFNNSERIQKGLLGGLEHGVSSFLNYYHYSFLVIEEACPLTFQPSDSKL